MGMLGSEAVVEGKHTTTGGLRQMAREIAMRVDRAGHVATAMQIEDSSTRVGIGGLDPFGRSAARIDGRTGHAVRELPTDRILERSHRRDVDLGGVRTLPKQTQELVELWTGHISPGHRVAPQPKRGRRSA
ncbi:MAG: hypothetical protein R2710_02285 [Acidimicrobiales bacterium]